MVENCWTQTGNQTEHYKSFFRLSVSFLYMNVKLFVLRIIFSSLIGKDDPEARSQVFYHISKNDKVTFSLRVLLLCLFYSLQCNCCGKPNRIRDTIIKSCILVL